MKAGVLGMYFLLLTKIKFKSTKKETQIRMFCIVYDIFYIFIYSPLILLYDQKKI